MDVSYSIGPLEYGTCRVLIWIGFFVGVFVVLFPNALVGKPSQSLRDNRASLPSCPPILSEENLPPIGLEASPHSSYLCISLNSTKGLTLRGASAVLHRYGRDQAGFWEP